jgi:hypothetical protein
MSAAFHTKHGERNAVMKRAVTLSLCLSLALTWSACASEDLSVGELRCQRVSCATGATSFEWRDQKNSSPEPEPRPELSATHAMSFPCPEGQGCVASPPVMALIERGGARAPVLAVPMLDPSEPEMREHWLWVGRPVNGRWEGEAVLSFGEQPSGRYVPNAMTVPAQRPDEAILALCEPTLHFKVPCTLKVYRYGADYELELLFEDPTAGHVESIHAIGDDLLVLDDYGSMFELTRYAPDGTIRWRQSALNPPPDGPYASRSRGQAHVRVLDDERIVAVAPNLHAEILDVLLLTDSGEISERRQLTRPEYDLGVYLEADGDRAVVGMGGYTVYRYALGAKSSSELVTRYRTLFYEAELFGMDVAASGRTYVATQDGARDEPIALLERISADHASIESMKLIADEDVCAVQSSPGGVLRVAPDESAVYLAGEDCYAEYSLPPE